MLLKLKEEPPITITKRRARLLLVKGRILRRRVDPERAIIPLEQSLVLYEEIENKQGIALALRSIAAVYGEKGDHDRAMEYYQQCLVLYEEIGDKLAMAICFNNIANTYIEEKGDIDKALENYQKSLVIAKEELDNKTEVVFFLINIGNAHNFKGDVGQANESFLEALTIVKEFDTKERLAGVLEGIGMSFLYVAGELNLSLEYFQRALTIFKEIDDIFGVARTFNSIGWVYRLKGELELALEYSHKSLTKHEEIDEPMNRVLPLINLATVYHAKNDYDSAFKYAKKTLTLSEECGNDFTAAQALYSLVTLTLDKNRFEEAKKYSDQLQDLYNYGFQTNKMRRGLFRPLKIIGQYSRLSEALVLKLSPRLRDKVKAQEIFQLIVEERGGLFETTSVAMLNLCELFLFELKASGEKSVLHETKSLVHQLVNRARQEHSFSSVVNALILQAKLTLVEGNLTAAARLLDQAQITAEEKGLTRLNVKVTTEIQLLEAQYDNWQHLIQSNAPYKTRVEHARVEDYLIDALKIARLGKTTAKSINE